MLIQIIKFNKEEDEADIEQDFLRSDLELREKLCQLYNLNPREIRFFSDPNQYVARGVIEGKHCLPQSDFLLVKPDEPVIPSFTYKSKSSHRSYSNDARGSLNIERLLANKPCYTTPNPVQQIRKKSILFHDWSAPGWDIDRQKQVDRLASRLLREGYTLYVFDQNRVCEVQNETRLVSILMKNSKPASEEELVLAASRKKISRDQLHILDFNQLNILLNGAEAKGNILETGKWWHNLDQAQRAELLTNLKNTNPPFEAIHCTSYPDDMPMARTIESVLNIPVITGRFRELNLNPMLLDELVKCHSAEGDYAAVLDNCLMAGVQSLTLRNPDGQALILPESFADILEQLQALTCLSLDGVGNTKHLNEIKPLPHLETLSLSGSDINNETLAILIHQNPQLKHLDLHNCKHLDWSCMDWSLFASLESLALDSRANLNKLAESAGQLKNLNLWVDGQDGLNISAPPAWKNLKKFVLFGDKVNATDLALLLSNAPGLVSIDLAKASIKGALSAPVNLPALEELILKGSSISANNLSALLAHAKSLKTLELSKCKNIKTDFTFGPLSLPKLEVLDLSQSSISSNNLEALLAHPSRLKILNLAYCDEIKEDFICGPLSLPELEVLNLNHCDIIDEQLDILMAYVPKLKILDLTCCYDIVNNFSCGSLPALEELIYAERSNTTENIQGLLDKAQGLRYLQVSDGDGIDDELDLRFPATLEVLDFDCSENRDAVIGVNLVGMLKPLKNLKHLLIHCSKNDLSSELTGLISERGIKVTYKTYSGLSYSEELNSHESRDHEHHLNEVKKPPFQYRNLNTKNQGMFIDKLSQYLTLTGIHTDLIPKLQYGMCHAATHLFLTLSEVEWQNLTETVRSWNGQKGTLNPLLTRYLDALLNAVLNHQFTGEPVWFAGDNLGNTLSGSMPNTKLVLANPWHAIAVHKISESGWRFYDPNAVGGYSMVDGLPALLTEINRHIGSLVSIEKTPDSPPGIENTDSFLENGGLLCLCYCENRIKLLSMMPKAEDFSQRAIDDGLLMRDLNNYPAWKAGLNHPDPRVNEFTEQLVQRFKQIHGAKADGILKQSLPKHIPPRPPEHQHLASVQTPQQNRTTHSTYVHYESQLTTWEKGTAQPLSLTAFCQQKVRVDASPNSLIELPSSEALQGMAYALQKHCSNISRPVFYIHSPEDLICQAPFVRFKSPDSMEGEPCEGPGGPLYDFLQKPCNRDNPPILVVNYSNFSPDDIVRFNSLLDEKRLADGVAVPPEVRIIGLMNTQQPGRYTGSDFYSRFAFAVESCPVMEGELTNAVPPAFTQVDAKTEEECWRINLFQAEDWKERLLGRWVLQGNILVFEQGSLSAALQSGRPVLLENAPTYDPDFERFWHQAQACGYIEYARGQLNFPPYTRMQIHTGYDWQSLTQGLEHGVGFASQGRICNPRDFPKLLRHYVCEDDQLYTRPGLLEMNQGKTLHLNVTHDLSIDAWAECLHRARHFNVRLHLHFPSSHMIPDFLQHHGLAHSSSSSSTHDNDQPLPALPKWSLQEGGATAVVVSSDPDTTIASITANEPGEWIVLDISECAPSDLFRSLKGEFRRESRTFAFAKQSGALLQALDEGKSVLLTGSFPSELVDALASLILKRARTSAPGRLRIVTDNREDFAFTSQSEHMVSPEEKRQLSGLQKDELAAIGGEKALQDTSLSIIQARLKFIRNHPGRDFHEAWQGINSLPGTVILPPFSEEDSASEASDFHQGRLSAVEDILSSSPYVFLTGLTGVGKTTFVREHLAKKYPVHYGVQAVSKWATDTSEGIKILFIDEVTLAHGHWSQFEGLFHNPKSLLLDGKLVTLSDHHRVVFAGNPVSYGEERSLARLFERHGNALVFEPLTPACIYHDILKPVFLNTHLEHDALALCQPILNVYQFVCQHAVDDVLLTPRELQMMALLLLSAYPNPGADHALHVARELTMPLLPPALRNTFDQAFTAPFSGHEQYKLLGDHGYIVTPSRQPAKNMLQNMLSLRSLRNTPTHLNEAQRYGGLGGMILEGAPGVGKSEFVRKMLLAHGHQPGNINSETFSGGNVYYEIPVSMGLEEKKQALVKAFHAGAVVVIDEINSSPMLEDLLNNLLMGIGPNGERPDNPGFMVIGTQNPATMPGRSEKSSALAHRMTSVSLAEYTSMDMLIILCESIGIQPLDAMQMILVYETKQNFAINHNHKPVPCFRNLLNLAKETIHKSRLSFSTHQESPPNTLTADRLTLYRALDNYYHNQEPEWPGDILNAQQSKNWRMLTDKVTKDDGMSVLNSLLDCGFTLEDLVYRIRTTDQLESLLKNTVKIQSLSRRYTRQGESDMRTRLLMATPEETNNMLDLLCVHHLDDDQLEALLVVPSGSKTLTKNRRMLIGALTGKSYSPDGIAHLLDCGFTIQQLLSCRDSAALNPLLLFNQALRDSFLSLPGYVRNDLLPGIINGNHTDVLYLTRILRSKLLPEHKQFLLKFVNIPKDIFGKGHPNRSIIEEYAENDYKVLGQLIRLGYKDNLLSETHETLSLWFEATKLLLEGFDNPPPPDIDKINKGLIQHLTLENGTPCLTLMKNMSGEDLYTIIDTIKEQVVILPDKDKPQFYP